VDEANELQEVVVKSVKDNTFNSNRTGAQTVINSDQIVIVAIIVKKSADFARLIWHRWRFYGKDIGYITGITIFFGLSSNGTNGGQTGVAHTDYSKK
jgi:hypothetical protein